MRISVPDLMATCRFARPVRGLICAAVLAGLLTACQGASESGVKSAPASPVVSNSGASPAAPDAGSVIEAGASGPAIANLPPEPPAPPEPVVDDDPQQLYGVDPVALDALLGQPSLIRNEAPAQIWQYRSRTCVFDVFLYEEPGGPRVSYLEARDDAAQRIEPRACLNELLRARMGLAPLG